MPHNSRKVSSEVPQQSLGSLRGCLVEGDPEQRLRERRIRRRSLIVSILTQAAIVALLILLPLFGRTVHLALAITTPLPPYSPYRGTPHDPGAQQHMRRQSACRFYVPPNIPPIIVTRDSGAASDLPDDAAVEGLGPGIPGAPEGLIPMPGVRANAPPPPVPPVVNTPSAPRVIHKASIDPAMLIHRVEPVYPPLAIQIHKEGRVELRAIIATDGTIQSLQVVSGDPLFYQSALEAVRQWRYKPTMLSGQPVAIDTYITVIYTMQH